MSMSVLKTLPKNIGFRHKAIKQTACLITTKRFNNSTVSTFKSKSQVEPANDKQDFIRLIFDNQSVFRNLSKAVKKNQAVAGLFENPHFSDIHGIDYAAQQAIQRAQIIVERICNAPENGPEEMSRVVKNLDRLSDTLCSVIDIAEFVRNAHPDEHFMEAANKAYGDLCSYMNTLNTDTRIHKVCYRKKMTLINVNLDLKM